MIGRISELLGHEIHSRRDLVLEILVILLIAIEVVIAFRP
jgi:K+-transporting ATPase A subunit